jgi:hypothetical protein
MATPRIVLFQERPHVKKRQPPPSPRRFYFVPIAHAHRMGNPPRQCPGQQAHHLDAHPVGLFVGEEFRAPYAPQSIHDRPAAGQENEPAVSHAADEGS